LKRLKLLLVPNALVYGQKHIKLAVRGSKEGSVLEAFEARFIDSARDQSSHV